MNDALKQRLVGAGVLLILAGLLWPLLFDFDERLVREAPVKTFPAMPVIARADIAAKPTATSVNTAARREPISAQMAHDADSETAAQSRTTAQSKKVAKAAALARTDRSLHASKSSQVETPHTSKTSSGKPVVDESRPRLDTNGVPIAWVIQTGTFSRWANASGLRDKLVAKGHNFPLLTLVGVIDADLGLQGSDLRAAERTFQLMRQVAGRAGRVEQPGEALLQTFQPEHPVIRAILSGAEEPFWKAEADERRHAGVPPYGRLAGIVLSAKSSTAQAGMGEFYELFAIAMAVIGGVSLTGGRGSIIGTVLGATVFGAIQSGFTYIKLDAFYQLMAMGTIIISAVVLDQWRQQRAATKT